MNPNPHLDRTIRQHKRSRSPYRYMLTKWAWRCPFCGKMGGERESAVVAEHIRVDHPASEEATEAIIACKTT